MRKVAIIGAGAAGMTAAITAASNGAEVVVLEHMDRVGEKNSFDRERTMQFYKYLSGSKLLSL